MQLALHTHYNLTSLKHFLTLHQLNISKLSNRFKDRCKLKYNRLPNSTKSLSYFLYINHTIKAKSLFLTRQCLLVMQENKALVQLIRKLIWCPKELFLPIMEQSLLENRSQMHRLLCVPIFPHKSTHLISQTPLAPVKDSISLCHLRAPLIINISQRGI